MIKRKKISKKCAIMAELGYAVIHLYPLAVLNHFIIIIQQEKQQSSSP